MIFSDQPEGWMERLGDLVESGLQVRAANDGAVPPGWHLAGRSIPDWHLLLVVRGHISYGAPGVMRPYRPGSLVIVPPGLRHSGSVTGPARFSTCPFASACPTPTQALALQLDESRPLHGDWRRLYEAHRAVVSPLDRVSTNHLAGGLLLRVARLIEQHLPDQAPDVRHVRRRVRSQPEYPWTVAELAAERGLSSRELQRRCRASTGHGPKQLILQERHLAAEAMLIEGLGSVSELARRFGYSEAAAFSRSFARIRGYPPGRCLK